MNYQKTHDALLKKAKARNWTRKTANQYVEKHHIIQRSFGGSNDKTNIIFLTAKEHYIIHLLLTKICTGEQRDKMIRAFMRMCRGNESVVRLVTSRTFQKLREEYSKVMSRQVSGKKHPMYGRKHTPEARQKMSDLRKERIKNGTNEGHRIPHSDITKRRHSERMSGRKLTEEHKRKLSIQNTGRQLSVETRKKISEALRGRKWKVYLKEKMP